MMGGYYGSGGGMMMGGSSYGWMMSKAGYQWMTGGTGAPGWMRGQDLPAFLVGGAAGTDPGPVMGALFPRPPGPLPPAVLFLGVGRAAQCPPLPMSAFSQNRTSATAKNVVLRGLVFFEPRLDGRWFAIHIPSNWMITGW